jgi:hypothetical protein
MSTGLLLGKKLARKFCVLTEEKTRQNMGEIRIHTAEITEMPCAPDQHLKIVFNPRSEFSLE